MEVAMNKCDCAAENCTQKELIRPGYAYVPFQYIDKVYKPETAMARGTIFPELDISINEYERGIYDGK